MELKNKKGGDDSKLWIIGDSFTGMGAYHNSWQYLLYEKFKGKHIYISSRGSRDIQTIFDIFLQNLYKTFSASFEKSEYSVFPNFAT